MERLAGFVYEETTSVQQAGQEILNGYNLRQ